MTFDDVNTNRFEVGGTGKDSVPRIGKRPRQPYAGGVYRPLTNGSNTEKSSKEADAARTVPSDFAGHHGTRLFVAKDSIHHESPSTHGSIHTGARSNAVRRVNESAETAHRTAEIMVPIAAAETTPTGSASASPSTEPSDTGSSSATSASAIAADVLRQAAAGVKTVGRTARQAAVSTKNAAAKAREAWHTFINLKGMQFVIAFFRKAHAVWKKRMKFSYAFYAIIFSLLTSFEVLLIQWGMYSEPHYDKGTHISKTTKILNSIAGQLTKFVSQMWLEQKYLFLINFVALALIYLALIFICNRFWIATAIFGSIMSIYAVANMIKIQLRGEPIIPADLSFLSGGDTGNIVSFIPKDSEAFVNTAVTTLLWFLAICLICFIIDGRRKFIHCSWKHPIASTKNIFGNLTRIITAVLSLTLLFSFTWNLGISNSWSYQWIRDMGYKAELWNPTDDAQANGPAISFLNLIHVKAMNEPHGYSEKTMQALVKRYKKEAELINKSRENNLTDNNLIMILSESFSDPTRVPGITMTEDPMPNIRQLKEQTTSGLMLSPGYGGGTANIEYQALTGLNLANFNNSLTVPYQQLVPTQKNSYSFNQIWNQKYGTTGSVAVHPYYSSMYMRNTNYTKFKFSYFYTLDSKKPVWHQHHIDKSPDVDDASAYQCILDLLNRQDKTNKGKPQFLQLVTMQNHLPYNDWYDNNEFKNADTSEKLGYWDRYSIDTYTKGLNYTDQSTINFLNSLNQLDKPVTVIFYGDHLPGIYDDAAKEEKNTLTLHETDYFIWSNAASKSKDTKLDYTKTSYTSSNYFMAMAADHMNAKVSPYLALLSELHEAIPAISRVITQKGGRSGGTATYLDSQGNEINKHKLSKTAKQLLEDYSLVQYDQTSGKDYLSKMKFTQIPE